MALRQALRDLGNDFRLLCVAAHPDDEDGATLALHRYKYGVQTYAVIATRGEGGQNEAGPELYEDLAVIRTCEMRAAAAITGAELHFLDLPDFGYSKSIGETQAIWGEQETLRRMVGKIRETRPHVIITHHGRDQDHGHHQAIGKAVLDAFDRAADPAAFPEQIGQGLAPWQTLRLYIRAWTPESSSVTLDISELEPARGLTYAEIAAEALRAHASQGMTFFIERYLTGRPKVHYDLIKTAPDIPQNGNEEIAGPLFAGIPAGPELRREQLPPPSAGRAEVLDALLRVVRAQPYTDELGTRKLLRAAACAAELRLETRVDDPVVVPGQAVHIQATLTDFGRQDTLTTAFSCSWSDSDSPVLSGAVPLRDGQATWEYTLTVPDDAPFTLPAREHVFDARTSDPQIRITARAVRSDVLPIHAGARVEVGAPTEVLFLDAPYLVRATETAALRLDILCTNRAPGARTEELRLEVPEGWSAKAPVFPLQFEHENEQQCLPVTLRLPEAVTEGMYALRARLSKDTEAATAVVRVVELRLPDIERAGLVESYDDTLRTTLLKLGLPHVSLTNRDFHAAALDACGVILADMRAYQYRQDLVANNRALLDYVRRGGTLIVMYHKTFDWKPEYAPYPIHLSRNRVTREDAPVTLLAPDHPLFCAPNLIRPGDWDGWVQERGLYFPERWDTAYTPLLACNDPGEDIPPGACLITRHGEGLYCYSALAWHRQLRELHPGMLRLFANLLALE
ncbi:MAG: PIG-L family deacetylase [Candidatus Hydrogenedentes bacterium]|nr:PIG-L family deacetylase [Candidatus Hydrogenedentota bacterium]